MRQTSGWAERLVAMWARERAKGSRAHALKVRGAYTKHPLKGLCDRYADLIDRHAAEMATLMRQLEEEQGTYTGAGSSTAEVAAMQREQA